MQEKHTSGSKFIASVTPWLLKRKQLFLVILKILPLVIFLCIAAAITIFLVSANKEYRISSEFTPFPLVYHPDEGTSEVTWQGVEVTIQDGFVKGTLDTKGGTQLVLRALGPFPSITARAGKSMQIKVRLENVSPDLYAQACEKSGVSFTRVAPSVLEFSLQIQKGVEASLVPDPTMDSLSSKIAVLGDSRDGYDTFKDMVERVNAEPVLFAIDNGDLVFSGKANQYRLFDHIVSQSNKTVCLVPGNHDIRKNGRETYELLYGPPYYSFDVGPNHYAFVDSSTGWATKTAIPDAQYTWLEQDLAKAEGKRLFVITHIPPNDPREELTRRESAPYFDGMDQDDNLLEKKIEAINDQKKLAHGFPTKTEADRFEGLMEKHGVTAVFLSHIHSYFDFTKNGVRYIITGGTGAELLTKDSYYHFLTYDTAKSGDLTIVERPTPANLYVQRYAATLGLFATALYRENRLVVTLSVVGFVLLIVLLIANLAIAKQEALHRIGIWIKDNAKYLVQSFRSIVLQRENKEPKE